MTWDGDSTPTGLRTIEICVPGANCTWCFNDATARLADLDGVEEVTGSILDGSIADQCSNVPTACWPSHVRMVALVSSALHSGRGFPPLMHWF